MMKFKTFFKTKFIRWICNVLFSLLTYLTQILVFGTVAYLSAILVAQAFIIVILRQVLSAGLATGLIIETNMASIIAGWIAPSLFLILVTVFCWCFAMYHFWNYIHCLFQSWRLNNKSVKEIITNIEATSFGKAIELNAEPIVDDTKSDTDDNTDDASGV